jgi:hypothetical protein
VYSAIERKFGTTWEWVPLAQFAEVVLYLQQKIDGTLIGRFNRSKRIPNYSPFEGHSA